MLFTIKVSFSKFVVLFQSNFILFFKGFIYLFIFRERGGRKKNRERNINVWLPLACPQLGIWPATQACALTGNQTSDPLVRRLALNPLSHTRQDSFQFFGFFSSLIFKESKIQDFFPKSVHLHTNIKMNHDAMPFLPNTLLSLEYRNGIKISLKSLVPFP